MKSNWLTSFCAIFKRSLPDLRTLSFFFCVFLQRFLCFYFHTGSVIHTKINFAWLQARTDAPSLYMVTVPLFNKNILFQLNGPIPLSKINNELLSSLHSVPQLVFGFMPILHCLDHCRFVILIR